MRTARIAFPSGRTADELRIDLDPQPGTNFADGDHRRVEGGARGEGLAGQSAGHRIHIGDLPYPPDHPKMPGEPKRVQPSRDRDRKE